MNYKHVYHAGNFADALKHITLIALLTNLTRKDTPYCYIDTHAGSGYYDLLSVSASKTKEYIGGIEKIIAANQPPILIQRYLSIIHQVNYELTGSKLGSLRYYPGSPLIAKHLLRPHDRIVACELALEEYQALKSSFAGYKQSSIHHTDGFLGLKAFLPPAERRGLVLIDPPYEDPDEFNRLAHSLPTALKRWESGIYAIWYPIKETSQVERFHQTLKKYITKPIFVIELTIYPDLPHHLNGSGLAVINPPWQFDNTIQDVLPWIWKALTINHQGTYQAKML